MSRSCAAASPKASENTQNTCVTPTRQHSESFLWIVYLAKFSDLQLLLPIPSAT